MATQRKTAVPDENIANPTAIEDRALRNVEKLIERNRRDAGTDHAGVAVREIRSVGLVGAGMMGAAIAAANVKQNIPVTVTDLDENTLAAAPLRIAAELAPEGESPDDEILRAVGRLITRTTDVRQVAACDLVVESVAETVAAKHQVYAQLEPNCSPNAILTSNTSTIPIGQLAAELEDRSRFCGLHFFHPVRYRPLAEIIRGPDTSDETIATAVAYAKRIEKMPIVVDDGPGFLVNRLLHPYLTEALELLLDGATIDQIERAATGFGMAIGPLRILDEIGIDTVFLGGRVLWDAFPDRVVASPLLVTMIKAGRLGKKSGAGFFRYRNGQAEPDPEVERIIANWARSAEQFAAEQIVDRLLLPMVLEGTRLLEERHVRDPRDVDLGVLFGLGFPAARGGLLWWADTLGIKSIVARLRSLDPLGPRAEPTAMLLEMAAAGRRFYT